MTRLAVSLPYTAGRMNRPDPRPVHPRRGPDRRSILLQQRGAGVGGAFGGEVTAYRSRRGIERTLFRLTIVLAILWVVFSVLALYLQTV